MKNAPTALSGLLVALLLAGCQTAGQSHLSITRPGSTTADLERDRAQCRYEVSLAQQGRRGSGDWVADGLAGGIIGAELQNDCLKARGWTVTRVGL